MRPGPRERGGQRQRSGSPPAPGCRLSAAVTTGGRRRGRRQHRAGPEQAAQEPTLACVGPAAVATQPLCGLGPRTRTPCGDRGLGSEEGDGLPRCAGRLETACDPNSSVGEERADLAPGDKG